MVSRRRAACLVAVLGVGCQGQEQGSTGAGSAVRDAAAAPTVLEPVPTAPVVETAAQIMSRLGAMPVWEGVVQRGQILARRGQRATLVGRVGPAVGQGDWIWLIDDTEGGGCLAARAAFVGEVPARGTLIAATGAWSLEVLEAAAAPAAASTEAAAPATASAAPAAASAAADGAAGAPAASAAAAAAPAAPVPAASAAAAPAPAAPPVTRWVWQVEASVTLGERARPASEEDADLAGEPGSAIGHEPAVAPRPPQAVPISKAKDNDLVAFQVLAAPKTLGEGWLVGDALGSPPIAVLMLPGERQSYGGIDFRQADEHWRLRRGVTYVVRIGRVRKKDPAKPAQINARNAPIKVS